MVSSGWKRGGSAAFTAAFGGLLLVSGCADLLGFQRPGDVVQCVHDSDCVGDLVCADHVCTACRSSFCVAADDASVQVESPEASAGVEPEADALAEAEAAESPCGDTTNSVANCGSCGQACTGNHVNWGCADSVCVANGCQAGWGDCNNDSSDGCEDDVTSDGLNCSYCGNPCVSTVCGEGHCLASTVVGPKATPSPAAANKRIDSGLGDSSLGVMFGIQITISNPSVLLSIGIVTSYGGPHGYLGVYKDVGGYPTALLASTVEFTLLGDPRLDYAPKATEVAVPHVNLEPGAYWILGQWDQSVVVQLAEGQIGCLGGEPGCIEWYQLTRAFDALPFPAPQAVYPYYPTPVMYVNLAQ